LHEVLTVLAQLLAPYCPFVSDEMYRNLSGSADSVHLSDWPVADEAAIDDDLEAEMALARTLVSLGRAARSDAKIGVRQPLPRAIGLLRSGETMRDDVVREIRDELNVKLFEAVSSLEGLLSYRVVPNFRALGPRLGPKLPRVKELLAAADGAEVKRALDERGAYILDVDGEPIELTADDLEIRAEQHEDLTLAQDGPHAVALDLTLDDALRAEGWARELSRAINDQRKANDYALSDRISATVRAPARLAAAFRHHGEWIAGEVLATHFEIVDDDGPAALTTIDGDAVGIELTPN
jgi:isoleucyl-tRNA synthetase